MDTHGVKLDFGKHKGELITRAPVGYLRWMVNKGSRMADYAKAEMERRGTTLPEIEISGHAIDSASLRIRKQWHQDRGEDEGLYSWLHRISLEALKDGNARLHDGCWKVMHKDVKFVFEKGEEFPVLKTVMSK